jgi:hypothetical protein
VALSQVTGRPEHAGLARPIQELRKATEFPPHSGEPRLPDVVGRFLVVQKISDLSLPAAVRGARPRAACRVRALGHGEVRQLGMGPKSLPWPVKGESSVSPHFNHVVSWDVE